MPVRKIPKNYISVTGSFSSKKNGRSLGYESPLEHDLMVLLEFDDEVLGFEEQPVRIHFTTNKKAKKSYVPDILIHYRPQTSGESPASVLGEVKNKQALIKNKAKFAPKFKAAEEYAKEHGWEWRIFTEKEIRIPLLDNIKFLREFHKVEPDPASLNEVIAYMQSVRGAVTIESLLKHLCPTDDRTLSMAPAIWHLLATKRIVANLKKPLAPTTKLSLSKMAQP